VHRGGEPHAGLEVSGVARQDPVVLEARLRGRPTWWGVTDEFVVAMRAFNAHLRSREDIRIVDTTSQSIEETVGHVRSWAFATR
jgi:hypothetical protein